MFVMVTTIVYEFQAYSEQMCLRGVKEPKEIFALDLDATPA